MLLRRITKHVKEQNWLAVALDFFIVVVGILIAFQITSWNETRQSHAAEYALTERLTIEFTTLRKELEKRLERGEQLVRKTADLITLIREGVEPKNEEEVRTLLLLASRYNAAVAPPTSFSDALQSGHVSSLRNESLRDALNAYVISTDWWRTVEGPAEPQVDPNSKLNQATTWSVHQSLAEAIRRQVIDYDWVQVSDAESELAVIYRQQMLQAEGYRLELIEVDNVLRALNDTSRP